MKLESEMIVSFEKSKNDILQILLEFYRKEDWDIITSRFRKIYWEFSSLASEQFIWYKNNKTPISALEYFKILLPFLQEKYIIHKLERDIQTRLKFNPQKEFFEYDTISKFIEEKQKYEQMLRRALIEHLPEYQKINARFKEYSKELLSLDKMYGFYLPDFAHCVTWLHKDYSIIYFPIYRLLNRIANLEKSLIHEIVHAIEYGENSSGINGPNRLYNFINEVRVDFLAYSILNECHNQKINIFSRLLENIKLSFEEESKISYKTLFPLVEDFLSTHQTFINTCAVHNDTATLIRVLGPEFKDFNDVLKETLKRILKSEKFLIIEPSEEVKKLILTMNQNYEKKFHGYPKYN